MIFCNDRDVALKSLLFRLGKGVAICVVISTVTVSLFVLGNLVTYHRFPEWK